MAFRIFEWLDSQTDIKPDAYTFTIMLSVCANLILKEDQQMRFDTARMLFQKCCDSGHVNDHVLWKLKLTVNESEYYQLVGAGIETKAADLEPSLDSVDVVRTINHLIIKTKPKYYPSINNLDHPWNF